MGSTYLDKVRIDLFPAPARISQFYPVVVHIGRTAPIVKAIEYTTTTKAAAT